MRTFLVFRCFLIPIFVPWCLVFPCPMFFQFVSQFFFSAFTISQFVLQAGLFSCPMIQSCQLVCFLPPFIHPFALVWQANVSVSSFFFFLALDHGSETWSCAFFFLLLSFLPFTLSSKLACFCTSWCMSLSVSLFCFSCFLHPFSLVWQTNVYWVDFFFHFYFFSFSWHQTTVQRRGQVPFFSHLVHSLACSFGCF